VTLTTTGYGNTIPVTLGRRIVAAGSMLVGPGLFSLLTSVVGRAPVITLFGSDEDKKPANRIVVIGRGRLPVGTDVRALVGLEASEAQATPPRAWLEGVLMGSDLRRSDVAHS
jgi:hypothetical protein